MAQVSAVLRRASGGYEHWCPACLEMHTLPDSWVFNNNVHCPTFSPSFKHGGIKRVFDIDGRWTGAWQRDANGDTIPFVCHYVLTDGKLHYCSDCTHAIKDQVVALPELPIGLRDSDS